MVTNNKESDFLYSSIVQDSDFQKMTIFDL